MGFNLNQSIPCKIFLAHGKSDERPFVERIVTKGQTAVADRYYQCHKNFDDWHKKGIHFVCRIRETTKKEVVKKNDIPSGSIVFYDAVVYLGTKGVNRTEKEVRVVGYRVDGKEYWVATDRHDLTGCQHHSFLSLFHRNKMSLFHRLLYHSLVSSSLTDFGGGPKTPALRFSFSR